MRRLTMRIVSRLSMLAVAPIALACFAAGSDTGAFHYAMPVAFEAYADSLADGTIQVYAVPAAHVRGGLSNVKLPIMMAITSWPNSERSVKLVMDRADMRQERGVRLATVGDAGLCGQLQPTSGRFYRVTFMGSFRDPKLQDPQAKSFDIYQEAPLDSLPPAPADVRTRLGAPCR